MVQAFNAGHSIYSTIDVHVTGNTWSITKVTGKFAAVTVLKKTNNPFGLYGKLFANFDAAVANYKNTSMKTALILAQSEFEAAEKEAIIEEIDRRAKLN